MGLGTYTTITFYGDEAVLDKIYALGNNADDGEFYLRVFGLNDETVASFTNEELWKFLDEVGVNSLTQAKCSAEYETTEKGKKAVTLNVYSTYDTPMGCWKKIVKDFPCVTAYGEVEREEDGSSGDISIDDYYEYEEEELHPLGERYIISYTTPEQEELEFDFYVK